MPPTNQFQNCEQFRKLHHANTLFILANAWDVSSAILFERAGYKALGTTSAGIAATMGFSDGERLPLADYLNLVQRICSNVAIPVNADIEAGYGKTIGEIVATVGKFIDAGAVGINIEDENQGADKERKPLHDIAFQIEKIKAIKEFSASINIPFVINGKTDAFWLSVGNTTSEIMDNAIRRGNAYGEAGADCVFVPGNLTAVDLQTLVHEIHYPLNIVIKKETPPIHELNRIGVRRLSMGSGAFRAVMGLTQKIALEVLNKGTYHSILENEIPYSEVKQIFEKKE